MAEPFTIYKLTILNMLDKVDFPLTNTQISDFFLEQEYTDYFRVQQVLNDLTDSGLIRTESTHSNTQYYITPNQAYAVRCQFRVHDTNLIDLTLTVKNKEQAEAVCNNWKKQNEDVYAYLMDILMK